MRTKLKIALTGILLSLTVGCAMNPPEADLLRENRRHLIESIRPALVEALDKAKEDDGSSSYIPAYKIEKVNTLDRIIIESARVAPTEKDGGVYTPEPLPWKDE